MSNKKKRPFLISVYYNCRDLYSLKNALQQWNTFENGNKAEEKAYNCEKKEIYRFTSLVMYKPVFHVASL